MSLHVNTALTPFCKHPIIPVRHNATICFTKTRNLLYCNRKNMQLAPKLTDCIITIVLLHKHILFYTCHVALLLVDSSMEQGQLTQPI